MTNKKTKEYTSKQSNKYTFQKVNPAAWLDILDEAEASGRLKRSAMYPAVLENIVVQPKLTVDDFENEPYGGYAELEAVITEAVRFQQGK